MEGTTPSPGALWARPPFERGCRPFPHAKRMGLTQVTIAVFIPVEDEQVLQELSVTETVDGVSVSVVAIGWV